jgi:hypothetical protein
MDIFKDIKENFTFLKLALKKIKLRRFFILIFFLIMSTFAWFTYRKVLDSDLKVHINTWNIKYYLKDGDNKIPMENSIDVAISNIYPGMDEQVKTVYIENNGEVDASISSILAGLTVISEDYAIGSSISDLENQTVKTAYLNYTEESNTKKCTIETDGIGKIPFNVTITYPNVVTSKHTVELIIKVNWDFDSDDDTLDSDWAHSISAWRQNNEGSPLNIKLNLDLSQVIN